MALLMTACAPRGVDEACCVVAEADSLWQAGQTYDDSLRLAQAYETLSPFNNPLLSTFHPKRSTDYAHACYHYGRLLRRADDPVAAMQVFI
jgi:predicted aminopeptidase